MLAPLGVRHAGRIVSNADIELQAARGGGGRTNASRDPTITQCGELKTRRIIEGFGTTSLRNGAGRDKARRLRGTSRAIVIRPANIERDVRRGIEIGAVNAGAVEYLGAFIKGKKANQYRSGRGSWNANVTRDDAQRAGAIYLRFEEVEICTLITCRVYSGKRGSHAFAP